MPLTDVQGTSLDGKHTPVITSPKLRNVDDLIIVEFRDPITNDEVTSFILITDDEEVFLGRASKAREHMSLDDYAKALQRVPDTELFPEVPKDTALTIASDSVEGKTFCKRPGLFQYQPGLDTGTPALVLAETLIMEQLSKNPHPNIVHYYGCRVRRGYIVAILIEEHELTLGQLASSPVFETIDHEAVLEAVQSAADHLHVLGLAHNDINPENILLDQNLQPILIDFGSCQPFGKRLHTLGTPGWVSGEFWTSEKEHDIFAIKRLREWLKTARASNIQKSEL